MAVQSARLNVKLNKVQSVVTVSKNDLLQGMDGQVDVVVSNILAEVIMSFTDDVAKAVKMGGYFIASGIIQQKKDQVKDAMIASGFTIEETIIMEDWVAFIAKRG